MPHKFQQEQADKLVELRRGMDAGTVTEDELIAEVRLSNGYEICDAMDQYGGTEEWNR